MKENAEKVTGKVTPYGFELTLNEQFRQTTEQYEKFLLESSKDTKESEKEVIKC
jgi:hypothetical protein